MKDIITVVNHKGGVGKTTITLNFGAELGRRGNKVLLVDLDSQGNLTKAAGADIKVNENGIPKDIAMALSDVLADEVKDPAEYISKTNIGNNVDIIAGTLRLADVESDMDKSVGRERVLQTLMTYITETMDYDYVLIDNAPSIGLDFQNSVVAADKALIVTGADDFSADGMNSLMRCMKGVGRFFKVAEPRILINKVDMRTNVDRAMADYINNVYSSIGVFETLIPTSCKVKESQFKKEAISGYMPDNAVAVAIAKFTEEFIDYENGTGAGN